MKQSNAPIYILSDADFDRIEALTEQYKMALYEFIASRELEPVSPSRLPEEEKFSEISDKMIRNALLDDDCRTDLF